MARQLMRAPYPTITPSPSSRSTRRLTAVAERPTSAPISANVRLALCCSNATILRSTPSKGRVSCTWVPVDCVCVAPTLALGNISHMTVTAPPNAAPTGILLELDGASLSVGDTLEVSRGGRTVRLSEHAADAVCASRTLKEELIAREIPIYG